MKRSQSRRRGSALLLATIVILIVAGLGAAFVTLSTSQARTTLKSSVSEMSLYVAEAGLEDAINKMNAYASAEWAWLKQNKTMTPADFAVYGGMPTGTDYNVFGYVVNGQSVLPPGTVNGGTYRVTITPPFTGDKRPYTVVSQGIRVTDSKSFLNSGGSFNTDKSVNAIGTAGRESRRIETVTSPQPGDGPFRYGLFGEVLLNVYGTNTSGSSLTGADVKVDSFKSSNGTYVSQLKTHTVNGKLVDYALTNGNIAANGNVVTSSSMMIMGNVTAGPGITPQTNGAYVSGSVSSLPSKEVFPIDPYAPIPAAVSPAISGSKTYSAVKPGSAHISSIQLNANNNLTFTGPVTGSSTFDLYVDGDFVVNGQAKIIVNGNVAVTVHQKSGKLQINGGGIVNSSQIASNFIINSGTTDTAGKINGGAMFYGAVYAPKADISLLGTGETFGAVVANTIQFGGTAQFHYDEDLNVSNYNPPIYNVRSWRESLK